MSAISMRAHVGRALIAFAVLLPAVLVVLVIFRSQRVPAAALLQHLTPLMLFDGALLGTGLLLQRGEGL